MSAEKSCTLMMSCAVPPLPPPAPAPAPDIPPAAAPAPPVAAPAPAVIVPEASVVAMLVATEDTTLAPSVVATAGVAESMRSWTASSSDVATSGAVTPAVVTVRFVAAVEVALSTSKHSPSQHWPFTLIDCKNGAVVVAPTDDVAFLNVVDAMKPGVNEFWDNKTSQGSTFAVKTTLLPLLVTLLVSGTPPAPVPDNEKSKSIARVLLNCSATVGGSISTSVLLVLVMLSRETYETRFVPSASTF